MTSRENTLLISRPRSPALRALSFKMFRLTRLPLRRCLHTAAGPVKATSYRRGFAVGLSAAALAFAIPTIALDSR